MESRKSKIIFFVKLLSLYLGCTLAISYIIYLLLSRILSDHLASHAGSGLLAFMIGFFSNGKLARTRLSTAKQVIGIVLFHIIGTIIFFIAMFARSTPPSQFEYGGGLFFFDLILAYTIYAVMLHATVKEPEETCASQSDERDSSSNTST